MDVAFVSGNFNILHPGHLRLFRFAKECSKHLIVGVLSDRMAGSSAHVPQALRLESVSSNTWVDQAVLIDEPVHEYIARTRPDIVVKGKEHELAYNSESVAVRTYGGKLLFTSGETVYSSLELIRREFEGAPNQHIDLPDDFLTRRGLTRSALIDAIARFSSVNVLIIGDLIVDEYVTCQALGLSQEDPTIVVTPIDSTKFLGGAGIVAAHAAGLGAKVSLVSVTGDDDSRTYALKKLEEFGVFADLIVDDIRPTTLKQRYRCSGKTLLRVSHLHQNMIAVELQKRVLDSVKQRIDSGINLLVFSDFNYGCLPQVLVDQITSYARARRIILAADSQTSSQLGNVARFKGMDLLTPTEHEARVSIRNNEDGLVVLASKLAAESSAKNVLLKMGAEGVLIHPDYASGDHDIDTDRIAALNSTPRDVAGAGDSLLIASAMALAAGASIWEAACIGSLAAALQVARVGNTPLKSSELHRILSS
jgi:rfaE bifunctional protein kinase chain/domain